MANTKQAKKRAEQSTRLRAANRAVKSAVRGTIKKVRQAADTDPKAAAAQLP
ncbi:MAG: 30S ribosomal protein S20, partial [Acidobacteria bacterium]|nr:30S ribosomal protein S20 [Acidobacteriota bacterium]